LETAEAAQAYGSGMAAILRSLLAAGVKAGTSVVAALDVYGQPFPFTLPYSKARV
jgi:cystathionine beta-lyase/cystathionine gamma-synthase